MSGLRRRMGTAWARGGRLAIACLAAAAFLAYAPRGEAVETEWWIADAVSDHARAETHGVVVHPDGTLGLGPEASFAPSDSLHTVWALAVLADGSVAVAGDRGRIDRWTARGGLQPWVRLPVGQVLALAAHGAGVVAGTGPEGLVYAVGAKGDTSLVARTGERYVWALAPAGGDAWYAATGTLGRLLRIEKGVARIVLDTEESNLVSLVSDRAGGCYSGGDSRGRVVHTRRDGTSRTLFDAPEDEVRALAIGADGALYAAALSGSAVALKGARPSIESGDEEKDGETPETPAGPTPVSGGVQGGKAVVYRIVPDSVAAAHWAAPQSLVYGLAAQDGAIVAATGGRAGLYRIEGRGRAAQWLAAQQGQVTAIVAGTNGRLFAGTSNPAGVWIVGPGNAARGTLTSVTLDAKHIAAFGQLRWRGEAGGGRVELHTRSGNADPPDTTWSPWEGGATGEDGRPSGSPPARYLQWRLTLAGGAPRIESVEATYRERNLPPAIEDLIVAPQGRGYREGDLLPRSEPVTQTLAGGQKVEFSISQPGGTSPLRALPEWTRGLRTVQWRGIDPNGDPLRYTVAFASEGVDHWTMIGEDLQASAFTWDASGLPDGRYRLRVTATDAQGNAVGEERTAEAVSTPFTVDNTPPAVTALDARPERGAVQIVARAEDAFSPIVRLEVSLDDDDWRLLAPEDGLADRRVVAAKARLDDLAPGLHVVSVKAVDQSGNTATRAARFTVPAGR